MCETLSSHFQASMGAVMEGVNWARGTGILETFSDTWGTLGSEMLTSDSLSLSARSLIRGV